MTKALIIGGGIAGPIAAVALQRVGIEAVVHEAHPGPGDDVGAFLSLAPNGLAGLERMGMLHAARSVATFPTTNIEFVNSAGRRLGLLPDGSADGPAQLRTITISRGALQRALADEAQHRGVRIEYNKRLVDYTETDDDVTAEFADGTSARGDVLLGADGIHSRVRRIMDPAAPEPGYTGLLGVGGYLTQAYIAPTPAATTRMVFGKRAFFGYQTGADGQVLWFANLGSSELSNEQIRARSEASWKQEALELFAEDLPDITTILQQAELASFRPLGTYDLASLPRWSSGRVVLLGDAAHAVSNSSGQGASLAIEDALVLATCLRDAPDHIEAFTSYVGRRRDRVERIAAEGRRRGNQKAGSAHPIALFLRDISLRIGFAMIARFGSQAWIHDYRIDVD